MAKTTIYLIRHGEAAQAWDEAPDPILSKNGIQQAQNLAKKYVPILKKSDFQLLSSPLARAQQTATPFQEALSSRIIINTNFAEIPSPGIALADRRNWLKALFGKTIAELEKPQLEWRNTIIQGVQSIEKNTLIFSHFMTINAIIGWITNNKHVVNYYPNYCSITQIEKVENQFIIKELGEELTTIVQ
ncbi:MAG: histidine phosphatase family protein [Saprospiraceae bacterium]